MKPYPLSVLTAFLVLVSLPEIQGQLPSPQGSFEQRVKADVARKKRTRTEGGDFDDKLDRIVFTVKLTNTETKVAFEACKGEFYVFAQSVVNPRAFQLIGSERFSFALPPRATHEFETPEWITRWDTTGARFGAKYDSWVLVIRDTTGKVILKKSSSPPWLPVADKMNELPVNSFYNRELKTVQMPGR
ncbi:MAG: hypothetical protein M3463_02435 [Verrucomicrobiota bacterium]|nr:hypothetical protein [Verrucomicrobiota bacterium]